MKKPVRIALCCICAAILAFSAYKIISIAAEYGKAESVYEDTANQAVTVVETSQTDASKPPITVDLAALQSENSSIIGWIYCEGTPINYPVVQSTDNEYFVRRMPDGTRNQAGSIFMDYRCSPTCQDTNTIIYGHNMKNGSMFASLKSFSSQSFYDAHPVVWFFTPAQTYRVELVAGYVTSTSSEAFEMFTDRENMLSFLNSAVSKSSFVSTVDPAGVEQVMTLATCSYEYDAARYVLIGSIVPIEGGI
ncbi:MAG: class B sortase [Clostridia bacterium]|nr:class B sortase [Clostridia bacterium]